MAISDFVARTNSIKSTENLSNLQPYKSEVEHDDGVVLELCVSRGVGELVLNLFWNKLVLNLIQYSPIISITSFNLKINHNPSPINVKWVFHAFQNFQLESSLVPLKKLHLILDTHALTVNTTLTLISSYLAEHNKANKNLSTSLTIP